MYRITTQRSFDESQEAPGAACKGTPGTLNKEPMNKEPMNNNAYSKPKEPSGLSGNPEEPKITLPDPDPDIKKDSLSSKAQQYPFKEIIEYLNQKAKTNYKHTTRKTQELIRARLNEGFTLEDFKTAIDNKAKEWVDNLEYCKYLRPPTLFGTKFESYLQQDKPKKNHKDMTAEERKAAGYFIKDW